MSLPFIQTWTDFSVVCLAQADWKGNWFEVLSAGKPHRTFSKIDNLKNWAKELNLEFEEQPEKGSDKTIKILGTYKTAMHDDYETFNSVAAVQITRFICYAEYTYAIISETENIRTVHMMSPMTRGRIVFDSKTSKELMG